MLSSHTAFVSYILELLEPIDRVATRRFFGGIGFCCHSVQFAVVMEDRLYFVVDEQTRQQYEDKGMQAFSYVTKKGHVQVKRYFEVPEVVLDDPAEFQRWAKESLCVAAKKAKSLTDINQPAEGCLPMDIDSILR